ncbi:trypsin-like peptidase domain-containing protein [Streptomyces sp. NPDC091412]|uniref:trypsin-like peptidase domain-containing protein n=1 Tax=Streptomyces sp. NPDC091412 TaxID=3366002 RepID=UPI0037FEFDD4
MDGRDLHESTQAHGSQGSRPGRHALRPAGSRQEPDGTIRRQAATEARDRALDRSLVRIRDLTGRPRGTGFAADHRGTVITSHEAVDGLSRLVLHAPGAGERSCVVTADAITALPALNLALVRTEGLGVEPLPVTVRDGVRSGTYVRIAADRWREARVLGAAAVTYTTADHSHLLDDVTELAIGTAGRDALRLGGGAAGGPVLDMTTGTVVAVLGTALESGRGDAGFAVPLRRPCEGPLADLLSRNAATVAAYGPDLNLAAVLELTATSLAQDGPAGALPFPHRGPCGPGSPAGPVERAAVAGELAAFGAGRAAVLGLVGDSGSGRTTELAALAGRRAGGGSPAPTLWLRGADLLATDTSVADAVGRALDRAARIVASSRSPLPTELTDLTPERVARLARAHGRPLLLLLDGPEEMPPALADRLPEWTEGTARWLRGTGVRLVVACREAYWEAAGARFPADLLHTPVTAGAGTDGGTGHLPPCLRLGGLTPAEAHEARARHGIPDGTLVDAAARHPLTLRLLAEVRAALPDAADHPPLDRDDVLAAHLDLMCLRIAVRLAAENGLRGTAVRRLAARVSGQVHEAARRSLGQGELDRAAFEELFPRGPAPARLGGGTGWAAAVLTEGLLVPAGDGYRFAHEELADWIQGTHLDLDEALRVLVHRRHTPGTPRRPQPVPHHRIGPVVQALLLLARQHGTRRLAVRLEELLCALDTDPHSWWASRLLAGVLLRVADATPYLRVLRLLAERIVVWQQCDLPVPPGFGPGFWTALHLSDADRCDLFRRLLLADGASRDTHGASGGPRRPSRYLDAVARLLTADPAAVQPHLTRWFHDERPLPATPHATVATAAQALLHTHRDRAPDDLTDTLAGCAHPRAEELLAVLAEEEPSALCRAVDRWAHDDRPALRAAALTYGLRTAPRARTEADRELLRHAALTLLGHPADSALHGGALALLVRDPHTRARHLPQALRYFAAGDPHLPPSTLAPALTTHPEAVLAAIGACLRRGTGIGEVLCALGDVATPALARRVAVLVREAVTRHPEAAGPVAAYVDHRLDDDPAARSVLFPLVAGLLDGGGEGRDGGEGEGAGDRGHRDHGGPERLRSALATVLAAPGTPASRPLRRELLDFLLAHEGAPAVLDAVLRAAASTAEEDLRGLVHRVGLLLVRTPDGAAVFDRGLVDLGRHVPGFADRAASWLTDAPEDWAVVVGPSARRMIENMAGVPVPA